MRAILHALSYSDMELESSRKLADLKKLDPMRIFCRKLDAEVYNGDYKVPLRLYFPSEKAMEEMEGRAAEKLPGSLAEKAAEKLTGNSGEKVLETDFGKESEEARGRDILLFFHGGGWVTESVENYDRVCAQMASSTGHLVVSVEYRLAPEHRFPTGLLDCYAAARALYRGELLLPEPRQRMHLPDLHVDTKRITVIGDSAGGNLAAALCLMARDTGEFQVERQILIYPALNNCYTEESPFSSVQENGDGYLLTAKKMQRYLDLYQSSPEDQQNPYFAPLLAENLQNMPRTLILTAEYDPLRDEGEAYGERLRKAGNEVTMHRIQEALHGFFALGIKFLHVQESFEYINQFLA
ncbi:MAG: alpha/beta hydrolase [Lachnospiraceae bacterium]|nr:alpha/beta hydrolase [Lachnospiraceae bacterium]